MKKLKDLTFESIMFYLKRQSDVGLWVWNILSKLDVIIMDEIKSKSHIKIDIADEKLSFVMYICNRKFQALVNFSREAVDQGLSVDVEKWAASVMKHELLHLLFEHPFVINLFEDQNVAGMAMDIYVNQDVGKGNYIPEQFISQFPEMYSLFYEDVVKFIPNLKTGENVNYYYEKLLQLKEELNSKDDSELSEDEQQMKEALNEDGKEKDSKEQQEGDGEGQGQNGDGKPGDGKPNKYSVQGNHDWNNKDLSDAEKMSTQSQIDRFILDNQEELSQSRGYIGQHTKEKIERIRAKNHEVTNWRKYIQLHAQEANRSSTTSTTTMSRPNKRTKYSPGMKKVRKGKIIWANDTSGSVNTRFLQIAFAELETHVIKHCEVTVIDCDTEIKSIYPFKKGREIEVTGRGGTEFQPVIDYCIENKEKFLVYVTDGECPPPTLRGYKLKILWLIITSKGRDYYKHYADNLPGTVVVIKSEDFK